MALEDYLDPFDVITVIVPGSIIIVVLAFTFYQPRVGDLFSVAGILVLIFSSYIVGQIIVFVSGFGIQNDHVPIKSYFDPTNEFSNLFLLNEKSKPDNSDNPVTISDAVKSKFICKIKTEYNFPDLSDVGENDINLFIKYC